jgi:hypothetical protein
LKAYAVTEEIVSLLQSQEDILTEDERQTVSYISYFTYCAALDTLVLTEQYHLEESFLSDLKNAASKVAGKASQVVSKIISDAKEFIPKIADQIGAEITDIIKAFKDPGIFNLLKAFGFSLHKMVKAILAFTGAIRDGLIKVFEKMHKTGVFQKLKSGLIKVDEVLDQYPILKKISGIAVAGMLLYIWLNMTFIGDLHYDFNWSTMIDAAKGSFSLADIFGSEHGLMLLTLFATGSLAGLSVPWLGATMYNMALAIVYTGFVKAKEYDLASRVKKLIHG